MRALLCLALVFGCSGWAVGQQKAASLQLEDGAVVEGLVVSLDAQRVVLRIDDEERAVPTDLIRSCRFFEVEAAANAPSAPPASDPAGRPAPLGETTPVSATADADPGRASMAPVRRSPWQRRAMALDRRYPWLFPAQPLQWISLSVMLFALLSLASHWSARLVAGEAVGFGRALGYALLLLVAGATQAALLPDSRAAGLGAAVGSGLLVLLGNKLCFRLSVVRSLGASMLLSAFALLGYGVLHLVDATLRSIGNGAYG